MEEKKKMVLTEMVKYCLKPEVVAKIATKMNVPFEYSPESGYADDIKMREDVCNALAEAYKDAHSVRLWLANTLAINPYFRNDVEDILRDFAEEIVKETGHDYPVASGVEILRALMNSPTLTDTDYVTALLYTKEDIQQAKKKPTNLYSALAVRIPTKSLPCYVDVQQAEVGELRDLIDEEGLKRILQRMTLDEIVQLIIPDYEPTEKQKDTLRRI